MLEGSLTELHSADNSIYLDWDYNIMFDFLYKIGFARKSTVCAKLLFSFRLIFVGKKILF